MRRQSKTALVLGGGNALGAYLAGACEYLDEQTSALTGSLARQLAL